MGVSVFRLRWMVLIAFMSSTSALAIPHTTASLKKTNAYITDGVITGGKAGPGHTLLGVRRFFKSSTGLERIVFDIGDESGRPKKGAPNFFHISLDERLNRVVVNFSQMEFEREKMTQFMNKIEKSPYIKATEMGHDPITGSVTLLIRLKTPIQLEAFALPSNKKSASRIVIDILGRS